MTESAGRTSSMNLYNTYIDFRTLQNRWKPESTWCHEVAFRCAFQAIEMMLRLLGDAIRDTRNYADAEERIDRFVEDIIRQLDLFIALWESNPVAPPPECLDRSSGDSVNIVGLEAQEHNLRDRVARILDRFSERYKTLPFGIGIEQQLDRVAKAHNLSFEWNDVESLPYHKWIEPSSIGQYTMTTEFGPENHFFATIHQTTECWFTVANESLDQVGAPKNVSVAVNDTRLLLEAAWVVNFLAQHIRLLELMVMDDYHPLRISLRGASGAQSLGAASLIQRLAAIGRIVSMGLKAAGLTPLQVYRKPHELVPFHRLLRAMATLELACSDFFHVHYRLALLVQSRRGVGSLGKGVDYLAKRFLEPLFSELDEARFTHLVVSNLQYASLSGTMFDGVSSQPSLLTKTQQGQVYEPETIRQLASAYFGCLSSGDIRTWLDLFEPNGFVEDPTGTRRHVGPQELQSYFRNTVSGFEDVKYSVRELRMTRTGVEIPWLASVQVHGQWHSFSGTSHFRISSQDRILGVVVDWSPERLAIELENVL